MFKNKFFALTFALALMAASAFARDANSDFRKWLKGMSTQVSRAFATENVGFFNKISTPDFTYTDISGKTENKKDSLAHMQEMFKTSDHVKANFKVLSTSVKGDTATASFEGNYAMRMKGPDKKFHKYTMKMFTNETYKKSGRAWLCQKIVESKMGKMTMDGKPFDPAKMQHVSAAGGQ